MSVIIIQCHKQDQVTEADFIKSKAGCLLIDMLIDVLAILQKSLDRPLFYTFLNKTFDRLALELLSLLCTFENSTKCIKKSFDSDSFLE